MSSRPGRHYKAVVAALGAALVSVALVVLASSSALAFTLTVEDANRANTQYGNWMFTQDAGASGGWESTSRTPDTAAIFKFRGTSITWKTVTFEGGGVTDVFLDGKKVTSFDSYSDPGPTIYNVTGFSRRGLDKGRHTLKLVATGTRGPGHLPGDVWSIMDRFIVDGKTIQEDSRRITYDGWIGKANRRASGGTYRESTSQTLGARCGLFASSTEIDLITATGPTRGMVTMRALNNNTVAKEESVNLHSSTVEWQHVVHMTGLEQNKTYTFEAVSADGTPLVFDGCIGNVAGNIN